jgi:putative ABC transport system permease protein
VIGERLTSGVLASDNGKSECCDGALVTGSSSAASACSPRSAISPPSATIPARAGAALFGSFGVLALVIAMVGIYGVTSYIVAQRTRELGVRAALGTQTRDLVGVGLRDTLRLVGIGVAIGLPLAYAIARGLTALPILYETSPNDPLVLGGAVATLGLVAMIASYLPARRAGRVDPLTSLRAR